MSWFNYFGVSCGLDQLRTTVPWSEEPPTLMLVSKDPGVTYSAVPALG